MLFTHLGLALGTHYCGGLAVESKVMIGHAHLDCGMSDMDNTKKDCEHTSDKESYIDKLPCCENQYLSYDIDDELQSKLIKDGISFEFLIAFAYEFLGTTFPTEIHTSQYADYSPPLIEQNISVLYQVFII